MTRPLGVKNKRTLALAELAGRTSSGVPAFDVLRRVMEYYWAKAEDQNKLAQAMHPQDVNRSPAMRLYEESLEKAVSVAALVVKYERAQLQAIAMDVTGAVDQRIQVVLPPGDWDKRPKLVLGPKSVGNGSNGSNGHDNGKIIDQ